MCRNLTALCKCNDKLRAKVEPPASAFDGLYAADISVTDYVACLVEYGRASPGVFAVAAVLLDRALERGRVWLDSKSIHRLLLAAFVIAIKTCDDFNDRQSYYALVGGVTTEEVNRLERAFLSLIDWDIHVAPEDFTAYAIRRSSLTVRQCSKAEPMLGDDEAETSLISLTDTTSMGITTTSPGATMGGAEKLSVDTSTASMGRTRRRVLRTSPAELGMVSKQSVSDRRVSERGRELVLKSRVPVS